MKDLENEILEIFERTFEYWKKDRKNEAFYDAYIRLWVGDYPQQKKHYLNKWEVLKENWRKKEDETKKYNLTISKHE